MWLAIRIVSTACCGIAVAAARHRELENRPQP
jgi:hypothetical protein